MWCQLRLQSPGTQWVRAPVITRTCGCHLGAELGLLAGFRMDFFVWSWLLWGSLVQRGCIPWARRGVKWKSGSRSLLQGIFPTQGSNPSLPHCRQILYQMSHRGSPRKQGGEAVFIKVRLRTGSASLEAHSVVQADLGSTWSQGERTRSHLWMQRVMIHLCLSIFFFWLCYVAFGILVP